MTSRVDKLIGKDTQHWLSICSDLIQANLFLLGIMWVFDIYIPIVVLMLITSVLVLASTMSANSKLIFYSGLSEEEQIKLEKDILRTSRYANYSYGFAFTLLIIAIALAAYIIPGKDVVAAVSVIFIAWIIMLTYNITIKRKVSIFRLNIWIILEALAVVMIALDYFSLFVWL